MTTTNLIGNAIYCFSRQDGLIPHLRSNPEALTLAIEEVLRFLSPVQMLPNRAATHDVVVGGQTIRAGQQVVAWIASANRDEAKFARAADFQWDRSPNPHLAFGSGVHFCLGAPLARLEATIALTAVLRQFATLELDENDPMMLPGDLVGGFKQLRVRTRPG